MKKKSFIIGVLFLLGTQGAIGQRIRPNKRITPYMIGGVAPALHRFSQQQEKRLAERITYCRQNHMQMQLLSRTAETLVDIDEMLERLDSVSTIGRDSLNEECTKRLPYIVERHIPHKISINKNPK